MSRKAGTTKYFGHISGKYISNQGYRKIKINGKWKYEHKYNWEKVNGKVPKGFILKFIDNDKLNVQVENLKLVRRAGFYVRRSDKTLKQVIIDLEKKNRELNEDISLMIESIKEDDMTDRKQRSIDVGPELWKEVKIASAKEGLTVKRWIEEAFTERIKLTRNYKENLDLKSQSSDTEEEKCQ
jgi:hypothetical protein